MAIKLVWERSDGSLGIEHFAQNVSQDIVDQRIADGDSLGGIFKAQITDADLPDNAGTASEFVLDEQTEAVSNSPCPDQIKCFRNAWRWDGSAIIQDAAIVTEIKKSKVRSIRDKLLDLSDKDEIKLLRTGGASLNNIRDYRQGLRDLGNAIDADPDNVIFQVKP